MYLYILVIRGSYAENIQWKLTLNLINQLTHLHSCSNKSVSRLSKTQDGQTRPKSFPLLLLDSPLIQREATHKNTATPRSELTLFLLAQL